MAFRLGDFFFWRGGGGGLKNPPLNNNHLPNIRWVFSPPFDRWDPSVQRVKGGLIDRGQVDPGVAIAGIAQRELGHLGSV